jgi:hypothetical protein
LHELRLLLLLLLMQILSICQCPIAVASTAERSSELLLQFLQLHKLLLLLLADIGSIRFLKSQRSR